jgi:hypothetical protein
MIHPLPGGFVAPTRDGVAGGSQTVISNNDLTGRNDRMLARAVHRCGIPGSTRSNQEAQGKNRDKDRAHDGRFQSSAARHVFGSTVDHPKLRVLHDRSIRRDNFVMPDHPTGKEALLRYRFTPYAPRTSVWPATRSPRGAQGGGEGGILSSSPEDLENGSKNSAFRTT